MRMSANVATRLLRRCLPLVLVFLLGGCTSPSVDSPGDADTGHDGGEVGLDAAPDAACIPTETTETVCDDGLDSDCDGLVDCDDPHCGAMPCDDGDPGTSNDTCVTGVCVGTSCVPTESVESLCDDGVDNDCSGDADCADTQCLGASCDDGNPDTLDDVCTAAGICEGEECVEVWVCDQCGTGNCEDVLIYEDTGCGCQSSISAACVNVGFTYDVDCGGGNICTYERQEITADCNCRWECP